MLGKTPEIGNDTEHDRSMSVMGDASKSENRTVQPAVHVADERDILRQHQEKLSSLSPEARLQKDHLVTRQNNHLNSHREEEASILVDINRSDLADRLISWETTEQSVYQGDQLATPANTQENELNVHSEDHRARSQRPKPPIKLPPSPQHTQEIPESQLSIPEESVDTKGTDSASETPDSRREEVEVRDRSNLTPVREPEQERQREPDRNQSMRSFSLAKSHPLLGRDESDIVSPSLKNAERSTPARRESELPSSPIRPPLSPKAKSRENVVVLIPPSTESHFGREGGYPPANATETPAEEPSTQRLLQARGFTTPYSYYAPLASLPTHFHDLVDLIAVNVTVARQIQRAKSGPRDYFLSSRLADSSCGAGETVSLQLFRPYKDALPDCDRGDVLLLRGMKVQTHRIPPSQRKRLGGKDVAGMQLLSTDSSAWAVFKLAAKGSAPLAADGRPGSKDGNNPSPASKRTPIKMDVQISGPPVEFGPEERAFAKGIHKWWVEEGQAQFPDAKSKSSHQKAGQKGEKMFEVDEAGREQEKLEEHLHEHELRDGMAYGDMMSPRPLHQHRHHLSTDHTRGVRGGAHPDHERRHSTASQDRDSNSAPHSQHPEAVHEHEHDSSLHEHELRDGMAYGDTISPRPIHEHLPHDEDDNHQTHPSTDEDVDHSTHIHTLRNGRTYAMSTSPPISSPRPSPRRLGPDRRPGKSQSAAPSNVW